MNLHVTAIAFSTHSGKPQHLVSLISARRCKIQTTWNKLKTNHSGNNFHRYQATGNKQNGLRVWPVLTKYKLEI